MRWSKGRPRGCHHALGNDSIRGPSPQHSSTDTKVRRQQFKTLGWLPNRRHILAQPAHRRRGQSNRMEAWVSARVARSPWHTHNGSFSDPVSGSNCCLLHTQEELTLHQGLSPSPSLCIRTECPFLPSKGQQCTPNYGLRQRHRLLPSGAAAPCCH